MRRITLTRIKLGLTNQILVQFARFALWMFYYQVRVGYCILIGQSESDPPGDLCGWRQSQLWCYKMERLITQSSNQLSVYISDLTSQVSQPSCLDVEREARPVPRPRLALAVQGSSSQLAVFIVSSAVVTMPRGSVLALQSTLQL